MRSLLHHIVQLVAHVELFSSAGEIMASFVHNTPYNKVELTEKKYRGDDLGVLNGSFGPVADCVLITKQITCISQQTHMSVSVIFSHVWFDIIPKYISNTYDQTEII